MTDPGSTSFYNPMTGDLDLKIDLFRNERLTDQIGTAVGVGTGLVGSEFLGAGGKIAENGPEGNNDGSLIGSIDWTFTFNDGSSSFEGYLRSEGFTATDLGNGIDRFTVDGFKFLDKNYVTSSNGDVANSYVAGNPSTLTLWGADGSPVAGTSGAFTDSSVGMDLVLKAESLPLGPSPVPVPGSMLLTVLGVAGFAGVSWLKGKGAVAAA